MHDNPSEVTAECIRDEVDAAYRQYLRERYPRKHDPKKRKEYYQRHKKAVNEKSRAYYQKHRETLLAKANSNYAKQKDTKK